MWMRMKAVLLCTGILKRIPLAEIVFCHQGKLLNVFKEAYIL